MADLLAGVLFPVLKGTGISMADLIRYIDMLKGYIFAGIFVVILVIVAIILSFFTVQKKDRTLFRFTSVIAGMVAFLIIADLICYGPLYANVSGALNASKIELSDDVVANSKEVILKTAEEGIVLLENEGLLPLYGTTSLNVFGWASVNPLYGGVGSGASDSASCTSLLKGLNDAGFETNTELSRMYEDYCKERPSITIQEQDWTLPEPTRDYYTKELMDNAKKFSDSAVVVIARSGGEGADLPKDMKSVIDGTYDIRNSSMILSDAKDNYNYTNAHYKNNGSYDDFDEGESYLELSRTEEDMLELVCDSFDKVIVIINSNNPMELGFIEEHKEIGALLLVPGTGATGMSAVGEVLNGSVNPSGRTADTYIYDLKQAPSYNNTGNFSYDVDDALKREIYSADASFEGNISFVNYVEGIYTGYKFYETASDEGFIEFDSVVQYPFGYGLSYTGFEQQIKELSVGKNALTLEVLVTNTGTTSGKDVIELYYTPPYTNGGIEKASVNLLDYQKTDILEPGEEYSYTFVIPLKNMASYDDLGIKTENGGYVLEAGEYKVSLRSDSHTVLDEKNFNLDKDVFFDKETSNVFKNYASGNFEPLSRKDGFANYYDATAPVSDDQKKADDTVLDAVRRYSNISFDYKDDEGFEMPATGQKNDLVLSDLSGAPYDDERWDKLLDEMSISEMVTLVNVGGWQTAEVKSIDKKATSDCDGPAGLSNFITGNYGTAFSAEVLMAQTWNKDLAKDIGMAIGQEYANASNYGWYGPALNIHRSAFGGRNFEYYSEDSVLSGSFAKEEVSGAVIFGVYPYIKHFALNDQETNRCAFLMTYAGEQAIREIYLKPFQMVLEDFDYSKASVAVMSSYNWIGTAPSYANPDLLNTVLRDEWDFKGMVITDYNGGYGYQNTETAIRGGGDLMLGYGTASFNKVKEKSKASANYLRTASKNILYTVVNSGYYESEGSEDGVNNMNRLFIIVNAIVVLLAIVGESLMIILTTKRKNK